MTKRLRKQDRGFGPPANDDDDAPVGDTPTDPPAIESVHSKLFHWTAPSPLTQLLSLTASVLKRINQMVR